ncbi:MAG: LUD domain-containing protein [Candidatus Hodarchaeales archaeon]|jgi:iron-sulfur cluster protein
MTLNDLFFDLMDRADTALENEKEVVARKRALELINAQKHFFLQEIPEDELKAKLRQVKEAWIDNLSQLVDMAIKGLEAVGCTVFLAKTPQDALQYINKIVGENKLVVKSKTNAGSEIGLVKHLESQGNEVIETDLGDRIVQMRREKGTHPIAPAIHISREDVAILFNLSTEATIDEIVAQARGELRESFFKADVGISGCNALATKEGALFLVENEGNIRYVSNAPPVHISICALNKIVPDIDVAFTQIRLLTAYATGQVTPVYLSMISGPSKTGDIELKVSMGMHGPREVHVVLIDNNRIEASKGPLKESLFCIGCGSCVNECPAYENLGTAFGGPTYVGPIGIVHTAVLHGMKKAIESGLNFCTMCKRCGDVCPVDIPIPDLLKYIRDLSTEEGLLLPPLAEIEIRIKKTGNPFGIQDIRITPKGDE